MTKAETYAERALAHVAMAREYQAKARSGSKENRAFYRRMARSSEDMVGVLMALYRSFPREER